MKPLPKEFSQNVVALRQSFDESFAAPPRPHGAARQALLAVRAGNLQLAVRLSELAGIHSCRKLVPLPNSTAGLLGISGLRGQLLAVYDLAAMLGSQSAREDLRWLLLAGADPHTALAIGALDEYIEVADTELYPAHEAEMRNGCVRALVEVRGMTRPVVSIPWIVDATRQFT